MLTQNHLYGLTMKDARTMVSLDNGDRLEFYLDVVNRCWAELDSNDAAYKRVGKVAANW